MTNLNPGLPTVVLVHGAFADAGSWAAVIERLLVAEVKVQALAIPMRGLASDSAYVASAISQIEGQVLAVGHSYGGAVISNACSRTANVVGLVFVNGFATELDEILSAVEGTSRDSALGPALVTRQYPTGSGDETAVELYVDPAKFNDVFGGDLPEAQASVLGASQRPIAAAAFDEKSGVPVEDPAVVGGSGHRRQGGRHRHHPLAGQTRQRRHHRGRRLTPDYGVATPGRH
jgi:pimeloyl-ACP methyl ester carboxylesterase